MLAIDLGLNLTDEIARQNLISRRVAHFYQRLALPVVGGDGIVAQGVRKIDGQLAFVPLRAQPEVNAEHRAFRGGARKDPGYMLGQADKIFTVGQGSGSWLRAISIEEKQVNV